MLVLAHAADYFMFLPVVLFVLVISIRSLIDQRRQRREERKESAR